MDSGPRAVACRIDVVPIHPRYTFGAAFAQPAPWLSVCTTVCLAVMVERRVISLDGVEYEIRPMASVLEGCEIWRGDDELGFFLLAEDGTIDACPGSASRSDEIVMRLVA